MKFLRVIDEVGNKQHIETDLVPRIGERILLEVGRGGQPVKPHYFRVSDVMYRFDNERDHQAAIRIAEEKNAEPWPE